METLNFSQANSSAKTPVARAGMDRRKAIELLRQKSEEAAHVASLPYRNDEYLLWRRGTEDILEEAFGIHSTEYKRVANTHRKSIKGTRSELQRAYVRHIVRIQQEVDSIIQKYELLGLDSKLEPLQVEPIALSSVMSDSVSCWKSIQGELGASKVQFGKRINFVTDPLKRRIIFRDVEQAFVLASQGFSKLAVILAGGVIEELLRLYLKRQNVTPITDSFDGYIKTCEQKHLLKNSVSRLSDSVRQFRNLVHIEAEKTSKHIISKATAKGAVSCIFTIANDF